MCACVAFVKTAFVFVFFLVAAQDEVVARRQKLSSALQFNGATS